MRDISEKNFVGKMNFQ